MPRLSNELLRHAFTINPLLPPLLRTCRTLPSAHNELRWLRQHVDARLEAKFGRMKDVPAPLRRRCVVNLVKKRARGVPLQYILGSQPFGDLDILCRKGVLIPRQATEEYTYRLSSILLSTPSLRTDPKQIRILDLCTGTGCIPLLLLSLLSPTLKTTVTGIDISPTALALARLNTTHNSPPLSSAHARFASGDVLASGAALLDEAHRARQDEGWYGDERFDVVTANPPYISRLGFNRDTERSVRNFEPRLALVPEEDRIGGVDKGRLEDIFYGRIVEKAEGVGAKILVMEVAGTEQAGRVARIVKVLLVLYDGGKHAEEFPELLGTTENELGIRKWLEDAGHTLVTTSDKDDPNSKFDQELVDAEVIITTPFHPGYLTKERLQKAKKLKLAITAGIGSDHVDLNAANETNGGITVAEVTGSNVVSVAEHVIMTILVLVRNFVPAHEQVAAGDWDVAAVAKNEYDLENKVVGTVAVGRIGTRVLKRLKAFDCKELLYFDYQPLSPELEKEIGCRRVENLEEMLAQCDVVTINCPLHEKTRGLFNKELISKMKPGAWLVNTARGAIVVKEDVAAALKSGHLRGYGGDVWFPQPAPKDHPLRYAQNPWGGGNAMVPHMSGTSIDAQKRYADGTKAILDSYLSGREDYRPEDLIVHKGDYATKAYGDRAKK
ncbi:formate dehydrogenase (NAD+) [Pseudogymnoascus verrucosus]|uniref:Formate dehydrogenase n=1 Tax=Pseudogymnoascus verrucosus TaxID=342668 RepID=A0A1B8GA46_9PEZI|nr:formate dehydrogenase (NAD+) [Pseudogymnoascus verrucosus]OBT92698.1 formate dehydrogenase (NAD+) [Pseudogymnoascus verrucosus]